MDENIAETLPDILDQMTALWSGAVRDRRSPLHTPVVTSAADSVPNPRIMVLRDVSKHCMHLRFHTDRRSPKASQIGSGAPIAVLGYHAEHRVQLTVRGTGRIEHHGALADAAWAASPPSSRRCYLAAYAPGTRVGMATAGLPDDLLKHSPTMAESQAGRENFAVLVVEVAELEWLKLTSCGNRRAVFTHVGEDWHGQWITP